MQAKAHGSEKEKHEIISQSYLGPLEIVDINVTLYIGVYLQWNLYYIEKVRGTHTEKFPKWNKMYTRRRVRTKCARRE